MIRHLCSQIRTRSLVDSTPTNGAYTTFKRCEKRLSSCSEFPELFPIDWRLSNHEKALFKPQESRQFNRMFFDVVPKFFETMHLIVVVEFCLTITYLTCPHVSRVTQVRIGHLEELPCKHASNLNIADKLKQEIGVSRNQQVFCLQQR